jgi:hypothetical protein
VLLLFVIVLSFVDLLLLTPRKGASAAAESATGQKEKRAVAKKRKEDQSDSAERVSPRVSPRSTGSPRAQGRGELSPRDTDTLSQHSSGSGGGLRERKASLSPRSRLAHVPYQAPSIPLVTLTSSDDYTHVYPALAEVRAEPRVPQSLHQRRTSSGSGGVERERVTSASYSSSGGERGEREERRERQKVALMQQQLQAQQLQHHQMVQAQQHHQMMQAQQQFSAAPSHAAPYPIPHARSSPTPLGGSGSGILANVSNLLESIFRSSPSTSPSHSPPHHHQQHQLQQQQHQLQHQQQLQLQHQQQLQQQHEDRERVQAFHQHQAHPAHYQPHVVAMARRTSGEEVSALDEGRKRDGLMPTHGTSHGPHCSLLTCSPIAAPPLRGRGGGPGRLDRLFAPHALAARP